MSQLLYIRLTISAASLSFSASTSTIRLSISVTFTLNFVIHHAKLHKNGEVQSIRSKLNKKDQNRSNPLGGFKKISDLCGKKVMEKNEWIKTEQMLEVLKNDPDNEQEYTHYLGGILRTTHWLEYDSKKNQFADSTDWSDYDWYTEAEFLEQYAGHWWRRDA